MIRGSLFTRFFLEDGIRQTDAYRDLPEARVTAFADSVQHHWDALEQMHRPSEAETISEFIRPIIDALGWENLPEQEPGRGHRDIADALLFIDEPSMPGSCTIGPANSSSVPATSLAGAGSCTGRPRSPACGMNGNGRNHPAASMR